MGCNRFTEKEIEELNKNPYVIKVSDKAITYSEEFKQEFIQKYQAGKMPVEILRESGFNTIALGKSRIDNLSRRFKDYGSRVEGTVDTRKGKSRKTYN